MSNYFSDHFRSLSRLVSLRSDVSMQISYPARALSLQSTVYTKAQNPRCILDCQMNNKALGNTSSVSFTEFFHRKSTAT